MHPELFQFFGVTIKAYSFFLDIALLVAMSGTLWLAGKRGLSRKKTVIVLAIMAVSAFVGARLLHIAINQNLYRSDPSLIFSLSYSGFSLYGGVLLATLAGYISCRILKLDLWRLADSTAPFLGLGIAFARLGCFLNGCCFGKITNLPWGVRFPLLSQAHIYQMTHGESNILASLPVHPTQIYEFLAALVASAIAIYIMRKKMPDGSAVLTFIIFFTIIRWINYSFFRVMPATFDAPAYLYPLLYAFIIAAGSILLIKKIMKIKPQKLLQARKVSL